MGRQDDQGSADEATAARDYVMARMLVAQVALEDALAGLKEAARLFTCPEEDRSGAKRKEALEEVDAACGDAAAATQLAMGSLGDIDPEEGEDGDDEEPEPDPEPARRRRRGR